MSATGRRGGLTWAALSIVTDEDRQFLERATAGSGQHDVAGWIVQLEVAERDRNQVAAKAGEIADGEDGVGVAVLAEDEIVDAPIVSFLSLTTGFSLMVSAR